MYKTCEADHAYRHGDSGPKYLMKGPYSSFGIVQLQPGDVAQAHRHPRMEESFFILEGNPTFTVNDTTFDMGPGDFLNVKSGEPHRIENRTSKPCKYIIYTDPFFSEGDKVPLE